MARTVAEITRDIEKLLYEYDQARSLEVGEPDQEGTVSSGVDFLIVFDVHKMMVDGTTGHMHQALAGSQSTTTSIGLAARAATFADELAYGGCGCSSDS